MAESLVGTRELTVTVLRDKPLCVTEIKTEKQCFYNYEAKYARADLFMKYQHKYQTVISNKP